MIADAENYSLGKIMKLPSSSSNNDVFVTKLADSNVP